MPSPTRGREDSVLDQAQLAAAPGAADAASQVAAAPRPRAGGHAPGERTPSHDLGTATGTRTAAVPAPIDGNRTVGHDSEGDRATTQEPHTDKPADKQADKQADTPTGKPTDKQADTPTGKPTDKQADTPTGKPTDKQADTPTGKPTDKQADKPIDKPAPDTALDILWDDFKRTGDLGLRERLILHYSPLVKYVAGRVRVGLPGALDSADFVSSGIFGLIDAIERFEPHRHVKFETYAIARIRGAIIDELRALDWIPRSLRQKAREIEQASVRLEQEFGRTPSESEIARELGIGLGELRQIFSKLSLVNVAALDELLALPTQSGDRIPLMETLEDGDAPDPVALFEVQETRALLARAVNSLPERDKTVVTLYYFEGMTLAQIGEVLGVSESRVCQIHTKAVLTLRGKLSAKE
ncbi:RNA polymerase, sigma 28 subunit, FliA/WhiG [Catenulispora acidiphila DSM 44928]|uniref:RNA polymerase sigma factor n=1 Tax=Catenulispora acidiphila (strain DSM 44928 / JCM 14897 / NBRC 102108 / NRRL B-24433 / ID139908) TaxID=479433 RepID=C7QA49_CATAD|nr:RNA polymerase sigma factor WhiG [Catenulispora acidiphila]ACU70447.1 RNA polymerase, sigma 28 subunit, FliA/WhiG [Catenulispora acidiphila DSM 44928]